MNPDVKAWEEIVIIPTYPVGTPEKNPMFLEKRVYQGSSGVVYPHAVVEKIYDHKIEKVYQAIFLENRYIKVMILPELGGRIQMAYDKIRQRHFVYYNQVIKPALVGLTGPWISGGIEFNWPQHHRPSTFQPVDHTIHENEDGSVTVWINEVERMFRTKGMVGFTLYPDNAFIEIKGKLYNRTPFPQTFLWWANPAVKVNDHYQSIFPPDVHAVFDHGKRDVSSFPIATGVYYKVDYSPGTDISWYKNIPVPTSFMAVSSQYDFMGGYEHDTNAGLLHVADHHIAPGKKQWTWGHGDFGQAWDRNLTDEDGPYIELMTGVFTDNQPDFSWLQAYEEKTFVQYFMPYSQIGIVKNANRDVAVGWDFLDNSVTVKVYTTSPFARLSLSLQKGKDKLYEGNFSCCPEEPYIQSLSLPPGFKTEEIKLVITDLSTGKQMISFKEEGNNVDKIPPPAQAAKSPSEIENNEQLFLTGSHIEQYRHATFVATDYYEEALRRDSKDIRCNNAMGLWYLKRGQFTIAEPYFRKAIETLTKRNPNPADGEAFYNLGWALMMQARFDEAFDVFYKSVWNDAFQHAGYLNLARIKSLNGQFEEALGFVQQSLIKNYHSHTARHLMVVNLRKLQMAEQASSLIEASLAIDPFNYGCLYEKYLLQKELGDQNAVLEQLIRLSRSWEHNFIEYALDYAHAGQYEEAVDLLEIYVKHSERAYPLVYYFLGWFAYRKGDLTNAKVYFEKGASLPADFVFPNRIEEVLVLQTAIELMPQDAKANYYLGNFWYDKRQYSNAIQCWERSVQLNDQFPTVHRNLALAYYNKLGDPKNALNSLEKAFYIFPEDGRVLMELDQLYKKLNRDHNERLQFLEQHLALVEQRDDLYLERITLYNQIGKYERARELILSYKFHPWEGGEGKVVVQHLICHIELAKKAIQRNAFDEAISFLDAAENYPWNLGEGKLEGVQENDNHFWKGIVFELLGMDGHARQFFQMATGGNSRPVQAVFYNDQQPDKILYQGLAWIKLGQRETAINIFKSLIDFGLTHIDDHISIDYFAVSFPDMLVFDADLDLRNKIHCLYLIGLGNLGLGEGNHEKALNYFDKILELDIYHQGAMIHKEMVSI